MKKLLTFLIPAVLAAMCLTGCSGKSDSVSESSSIPEVKKQLQMPDVEIDIPDSYEKSSTENNEIVYLKDDISVIVNEDVFTEGYKTKEEYIAHAKDVYAQYSDTLEILGESELKADGITGTVLEYIYTLKTDSGLFSKYCMTVFFTDGEKMYLVTFKADSDKYENYREEFLDIAGTFGLNK